MNRCRSERGKQPRVIPCSKGKYGFGRRKFEFFFKNLPENSPQRTQRPCIQLAAGFRISQKIKAL
jgi:hypothetical protein